MLGFVGVHTHRWYPSDVEVGWRLARHAWGRGYATEAARTWTQHALTARAAGGLGLTRVISITDPSNRASLAVMRRLGMRRDHEAVHDGVPVVVHVLEGPDRAFCDGSAAG